VLKNFFDLKRVSKVGAQRRKKRTGCKKRMSGTVKQHGSRGHGFLSIGQKSGFGMHCRGLARVFGMTDFRRRGRNKVPSRSCARGLKRFLVEIGRPGGKGGGGGGGLQVPSIG